MKNKVRYIGVTGYLLVCLSILGQTSQQLANSTGPRGIVPAGNYSISDLETVDTVYGGVTWNIPLVSMPPGRAGMSLGLPLIYNSNFYDADPQPGGVDLQAGQAWRYGYEYGLDIDYVPGTQNCLGGSSAVQYVRLSAVFPDGSHHSLRLYKGQDLQGEGFYDEFPGNTLPSGCTVTQTGDYVYYTTDGTFLKVVISASNGTSYWATHPWAMYLADGRQVNGFGAQASTISDANGNKIMLQNIDDLLSPNGLPEAATLLQDDVGRQINVTHVLDINTQTTTDVITQTGANNSTLTWTVTWQTQTLSQTVSYGNCATTPCLPPAQLTMLTSIAFPAAANDPSPPTYLFTYNLAGWGQLNNVTLPSGGSAHYCYQFDFYQTGDPCSGVPTLLGALIPTAPPRMPVLRKIVSWCDEFDLPQTIAGGGCPGSAASAAWNYTFPLNGQGVASSSTATGPDGGTTTTYFNAIPPPLSSQADAGLVTLVHYPDGSSVAKQWAHNTAYETGSDQTSPQNPYVQLETDTAPSGATRTKTFHYDKNGNVTQEVDSDWSTVGGTLRTQLQVYSAPSADASAAPAITDTNAYWSPSSPALRSLARCRAVTGAGNGTVNEFDYDTKGNIQFERDWDSTQPNQSGQPACSSASPYSPVLNSSNAVVLARTFDAYGNLTDAADGNGNHAHTVYDGNNLYPSTIYEAYGSQTLQRSTSLAFDFNTGLMNSETDYNGLTRAFTFDNVGRPTQLRESGASGLLRETAAVYEDAYRRVITKSDNVTPGDQQLVSVTGYDQLGRVRLTRQLENASQSPDADTDGIKVQSRYLYSGAWSYQVVSNPYRAGTAATATAANGDPNMGWTLRATDQQHGYSIVSSSAGNAVPTAPAGLTSCSSPGNQLTCSLGTVVTSLDEGGVTRTMTVDGLGRLTQVVENGIPATTNYQYDVQGDLTQVSQAGTPNRSFTYDSLGRLGSATNPEAGTIGYSYDKASNLTGRTDQRAANPGPYMHTTLIYDSLNRLTDKQYSDYSAAGPTPWVHYSYQGTTTDFVSSVGSNVSTYTYSNFDALGRPGAGTQATAGQTAYTFPSVVWTPRGDVASITYPSGRVVTTCFDGAGQINSVRQSACTSNATYVSAASYAAHGGISGMTTGDGLGRSTAYNAKLQTTAISAGSLLTLGPLNWNANGTLGSQSITRGSFTAAQTYQYDGVNRLKSVAETNNGGHSWSQNYIYDNPGNRAVAQAGTTDLASASNFTPQTSLTSPPPPGSIVNWPYDPTTNRWASPAAAHDAAGNMTGLRTQTMVYDAESRMISWSDSSTSASVSFGYDGDGRRVTKTPSSGAATLYVYDPAGNLAVEYGGAAITSNQTLYLTQDHLGSTRLVSVPGGTCAGAHDYLPFGEEIPGAWGRSGVPCYAAADTTMKFTGQERDTETALDNFLARHMAAPQGRFLSPDPDNAGADPANPQSWNMYGYAVNNPLRFVDPTGLTCITVEVRNDDGTTGTEVADDGDGNGCADASGGPIAPGNLTPQSAEQILNSVSYVNQTVYGDPPDLPTATEAGLDLISTSLSGVADDVGQILLFSPKNRDPIFRLFSTHYCGPGGGGQVTGGLDPYCQTHDLCYDRAGLSAKNNTGGKKLTTAQTAAAQRCNQALFDNARQHPEMKGTRALQYWLTHGPRLAPGTAARW